MSALGTGDPVEKAQVLLLKASLRGNQQRFREAFTLLDRVIGTGRRCDDSHLCGKALIMRGFLLGLANDPESAIRHLQDGLEKLDPAADPRLVIVAQHNLTLYLAEGGRYCEALRLLESARPLYYQIGDPMSLLRLRWVEGKIASALGTYRDQSHRRQKAVLRSPARNSPTLYAEPCAPTDARASAWSWLGSSACR